MLLNLALFHEYQRELKTGGRFWVVFTHEQWYNHHAAHTDETETKKQKWMTVSTHPSIKINKINIQISPKSMALLWKRGEIRCELAEPGQFPSSKCCLVCNKLPSPSFVLCFLYKGSLPCNLPSWISFFSQLLFSVTLPSHKISFFFILNHPANLLNTLFLFVCLSFPRKLQNSLQPPPFHLVVPHFHPVVSSVPNSSPTGCFSFTSSSFWLPESDSFLGWPEKNPKPSPKGVYNIGCQKLMKNFKAYFFDNRMKM